MDDACRSLTFGSLFAGIGGIDLGFERAGMVGKWQVEIDPYARRVLAKHWPDVRRWDDIRTFPPEPIDDWRVDVIAGGFPCQDISYAGKGAGLHGERSGLFFELIRVVRVLGPRIVVLENVAALLTRGLDQVLGTLASIGFDAEWHCIPAAAVGAPHIRDRVFILGHANEPVASEGRIQPSRKQLRSGGDHGQDQGGDVPDSDGSGSFKQRVREVRELAEATRGEEKAGSEPAIRLEACGSDVPDSERDGRQQGPEVPQVRKPILAMSRRDVRRLAERNRGEGGVWFSESGVRRISDGVPNRVHRLRGLGNAVVPQVAEFIGRRIVEAFTDKEGDYRGE